MSNYNSNDKLPQQELYRKPFVLSITGLSHSTLYYLMKEGTFPKQVKIGARAVAWRKSDIDAWLAQL